MKIYFGSGGYSETNEQNEEFNLQPLRENICEENKLKTSHDAPQGRKTVEM